MHHHDENWLSVHWTKRHHVVWPLDCIDTSEITLGRIYSDNILASIKINENSGAAPQNWINYDACH